MSQTELREKVQEMTGVGENLFDRKILPSMELGEIVAWERGKGKTKLYYLINQPIIDNQDFAAKAEKDLEDDKYDVATVDDLMNYPELFDS